MDIKIFNVVNPKESGMYKYFNMLPVISFVWKENCKYIQFGWLHLAMMIIIKEEG